MSRVPDRDGQVFRRSSRAGGLLLAALLAGCLFSPSPTPSASPTASSSVGATASPPIGGSSESSEPSATPEPALSLPLPGRHDSRKLTVRLDSDVAPGSSGEIVVTVTNRSERQVKELVLRWPTDLRETLFLAPFRPSQQRIVDGGPPLLQDWTKWVEGPGESGEPAGTTSLGWGPLLPGGTLTIPIQVTRNARGEVSFDLQVLASEAILTLEDGSRAELRVTVP
ncbi:MAG TPA: hypothetical protein VES36_01855 [Candidatus Limnocylindrales bacterium]|nr:hypothetical protein [Candidatus Limnocylindrales bacterium]